MRGDVERQTMILSAGTPDQLIPQDHPIRLIKPMVDRALSELSPTFSQMYAKVGRPSIPPEHLLKGMPVDGPLHHKERAPVLRAAAI